MNCDRVGDGSPTWLSKVPLGCGAHSGSTGHPNPLPCTLPTEQPGARDPSSFLGGGEVSECEVHESPEPGLLGCPRDGAPGTCFSSVCTRTHQPASLTQEARAELASGRRTR